MTNNQQQISVVTANLSRDTNTIKNDRISMDSYESITNSPRAIGLQNSFGVPSFSPWPIESIVSAMINFYPSEKTKHYKIAKIYLKEVKAAVQRGILLAQHQQLEDGLIPIEWRALRTKCGRFGSRGQETYWFDWFQEHYPLLEKITEGYKFGKQGKLTMARTTIDIEILIAGQDPDAVFKAYYGNLNPDADIDLCPIDQKSLGNYILANKAIVKRTLTLDDNLKSAQTILLISQSPQCRGFLPQVVSESDFGRRYYKGINLQTSAKIVRHAALGDCHQYDIEASVFTWKLDFVKGLYDIKLPATIDYLEFKNHHRTRLAELIFGTKEKGYVNYIKQAITAIGFGARKTNAVWMGENGKWKKTALREIIKSSTLLDQLLKDKWVEEFIQEQEKMNTIIWEEIKDLAMIKDDANLRNLNNQISKNKAIAKAYQTTERRLLDAMSKIAESSQVTLACHDGFYTKHKAKLAELKECLQSFLPSGQLDYAYHSAYFFQDTTDLEAHRNWIQQEEQAARLKNPIGYQRGNNEFEQLKKKYARSKISDDGQDHFNGSHSYQQAEFQNIYEDDEE
jgi:ASC-1-like (ASCH) protein